VNAVPNLGLEEHTKAYKPVTKLSGFRPERDRRPILGMQLLVVTLYRDLCIIPNLLYEVTTSNDNDFNSNFV